MKEKETELQKIIWQEKSMENKTTDKTLKTKIKERQISTDVIEQKNKGGITDKEPEAQIHRSFWDFQSWDKMYCDSIHQSETLTLNRDQFGLMCFNIRD